MASLDLLVRQGKALHIGMSNYPASQAEWAFNLLRELGTPCLIHQPKYSTFERWVEPQLLSSLASQSVFLSGAQLTEEKMAKVRRLNAVTAAQEQKLAQMALAWVLRNDRVTSVLIGASKTAQIDDVVAMLSNRQFSERKLAEIEAILA